MPWPLQEARDGPSAPTISVLLICDRPELRKLVRKALTSHRCTLQEACSVESALARLRPPLPDCVLLDDGLPGDGSLAVLQALHGAGGAPLCAVVVLATPDRADFASAAMRHGALDCVAKANLAPEVLRRAVRGAAREFRLLEAQRASDQRNAQLAAIVNASADAIISVDPDDVVRTWNSAACRLLGYGEGEACGRKVGELIVPPSLEAERREIFATVLSGRAADLKETVRRHKDGHLVPVEIKAAPVLDASGSVCAVCVIMRDISERQRSAVRFRQAADATRALVYEIDLTSRERAGAAYGLHHIIGEDGAEDAFTSDWWHARIHPDELQEHLDHLRKCVDDHTCGDYRAAYRVRHVDGSWRHVEDAGHIQRAPDGVARYLVGIILDVSDRKRREAELAASEARFRTMANTTPAVIWTADPAGAITFHNQRWADYTGLGAHETDDWPRRVLHPDDHDRCLAAWADALATGSEYEVEVRNRRHDGVYRWFVTRATPIRDAGSGIVAWYGSSTDIHDRKVAEAELRASEHRLQLALDAASAGTWSWNGEKLESTWDDRYHALYGLEPGGPRGFEVWMSRLHPDDRAAQRARVEQMLATPGDDLWDEEFRILHPGKGVRWIRGIGRAERDRNGRISLMSGINLDITERKLAEERLRESEERFRTIFTTAQGGIWAVDAQGRTLLANPRMAEMLGTSIEALAGRPATDFCFPEDAADARERMAANLAGRTEEFEFRFRRSDGSALPVLAATAPLRGRDGAVTGALGGFVDLTERTKAEGRQRLLMREITHRGKNLLAVVQSIATRTLAGERPLDDARTAFIGRLQALARTYSSLTEELFEGALLESIVASELCAFGGRVRLGGPKIMLAAKVAQNFGLVVHELATNAAKFGALSARKGRLDVSWRVEGPADARRFLFEWIETGGPPAQLPAEPGFGSTLITAVAGSELQCTPEIAFTEQGFRYRLDAPLTAVGSVIEESPVRGKLQSATLVAFYDAWASLCGPDGRLPLFRQFPRDRFAASGGLTIVEISGEQQVRFLEVGRALTERLGRLVAESDLAGDNPDSLQEAYRLCARSAAPCYENLRFDFGDGNTVTFERLLVPFTRGGRRVTHLAGLVVYSGTPLTRHASPAGRA